MGDNTWDFTGILVQNAIPARKALLHGSEEEEVKSYMPASNRQDLSSLRAWS